ncbi:hypothetical protein ERJ75_000685200 [Trypanosoma vivax]|nr:hypothetical protein ERJ75_000685200 [Trypanosoma vivax]
MDDGCAVARDARGAVSETSRQKVCTRVFGAGLPSSAQAGRGQKQEGRSSCIERRGRKGDSQSGLGTGEARAGERQGPAGNGRALRAGGDCLFLFWMRHARKRRRRRREQVARSRVETAVCGHRERRDTKGASVVRERATLREAGAQGVGAADSHGA